jgi:hypothetical protein
MAKNVYALLIILFMLAAAIAGDNQSVARAANNISTPDRAALSVSPSEPVNTNNSSPATSTISPFNEAPLSKALINIFLFDHSPQPCWLSLAPNQGQGLTLNPVSPQAKLAAANIRRTAGKCRHSELHMPLWCSRYLLESSPPGFFLLI